MKKEKESFKDRIIDALLELLIAVICLVVGFWVLKLFGVDVSVENADIELIILLGLAVSGAVFVGGYFLFKFLKKKFKK